MAAEPGLSIATRIPFVPSDPHGTSLPAGTPASRSMDQETKHAAPPQIPSMSDHLRVDIVSVSALRATAADHMPFGSPTILMPGYFAKTAWAASLRSVATVVPGTPVMKMRLPL